jgi:hypothetical protein
MPRSHSPAAYPTAYWRLIEGFTKSELPIHVSCTTPAEAVNRRNEWNSFIRALERSKDPRNLELARIARGRICCTGGAKGELLIWKSRDTGTFIESLDEALDDYDDLVGQDAAPLAYDPATIEKLEAESQDTTATQQLIDDFIGTPEENSTADGIFDEFLEQADKTTHDLKEETTKNSFANLLSQPLRPQRLNRTFSSETNNPDEIN